MVAEGIASAADMKLRIIESEPFKLTVYARISERGGPIRIYFEGDGHSWISHERPSADPTPKEPIGLKLAAVDPSPNVVYLARPCQYTPFELNQNCDQEYWTTKRFSEEVIRSLNAAVDTLVGEAGAKEAHLIGYSGGAAVAVLIAARRQDVASVRTVAGYLDPALLNNMKRVTPLSGSLDPMAVAPTLHTIPQRHFVGAQDDRVPPFIAHGFVKRVGGDCAQVTEIKEAGHQKGWVQIWKNCLAMSVACQ